MVNPVISICAFSVPLFSSRASPKLQGMYPKKRLLNCNEVQLLSSQTSMVKAQKLGNKLSGSNGLISCSGLSVQDYCCSCSNVVVLVGYWVSPDPDDGWGYVEASLNQTHRVY